MRSLRSCTSPWFRSQLLATYNYDRIPAQQQVKFGRFDVENLSDWSSAFILSERGLIFDAAAAGVSRWFELQAHGSR